MIDPHPFAPRFEHAFTISIDLSKPFWVKPGARGDTRAAIYAAAGTVEGPRLNGRVVPMSGGDFPLSRPNGVIDFDARYLLEADDGPIIYLENGGYRWARNEVAGAKMRRNEAADFSDYYMRVTPKFDAPAGPHEWLSKHVFVGVAEKLPGAMHQDTRNAGTHGLHAGGRYPSCLVLPFVPDPGGPADHSLA